MNLDLCFAHSINPCYKVLSIQGAILLLYLIISMTSIILKSLPFESFSSCLNQNIISGMKYLSMFLPTTSSIPSEKGWKLWFEEFMSLWMSFSNSPPWEPELFHLYTRLAFHNCGQINWIPYLEILFTKFMVALELPVTYGQSGIKIKFSA